MISCDQTNYIIELSLKNRSKPYIKAPYYPKFTDLLIVTIYSNFNKSYDKMNNISTLSLKNGSELYITSLYYVIID